MTRWENTSRPFEWQVGDEVWVLTEGTRTDTLYVVTNIVQDEAVLEWASPLQFRIHNDV